MHSAVDLRHVAVKKPGLFSLIRRIDRRFRAGIDRNVAALELNASELELLRQIRERDTTSAAGRSTPHAPTSRAPLRPRVSGVS